MPEQNEGSVAPGSIEAEALAELQKEGFEVGEHQSAPAEGNKPDFDPAGKDEEPEEEEDETPEEDEESEPEEESTTTEAPDRTPAMVPAWKLKVAEEQANRKIEELQKLVEESKQKGDPVDQTTVDTMSGDIDDLIKKAEENGSDGEFLREFAETILKKATDKVKPSADIVKVLEEIQEERTLEKELNAYSAEFDKDVLPLVKEEYGLDEPALLELKEKLKDLAFTETYAKVPLAKIFKAEFDSLGLKQARRSGEGKGIKIRHNEVVDLENLSEEDFSKLPDDKVEEFMNKKGSGWHGGASSRR